MSGSVIAKRNFEILEADSTEKGKYLIFRDGEFVREFFARSNYEAMMIFENRKGERSNG